MIKMKPALFMLLTMFMVANVFADQVNSLTGNPELDANIHQLQQKWALIKYR